MLAKYENFMNVPEAVIVSSGCVASKDSDTDKNTTNADYIA